MAGIYIHFPFCKQKCNYCNFYSLPLGKQGSVTENLKNQFVKALLKEIQLQKQYLEGETIKSIYFGGGTPSLLSQNEIKTIINQLYNCYNIECNAEITFEANPDDLDRKKLIELKWSLINRLSIGIQSFFDSDLQYLSRVHKTEQGIKSIIEAKEAGFDNISIDLIYGIPGLTSDNWFKILETTFSLGIQHISAYSLTVERKTTLAHFIKKGKLRNVDENDSNDQYNILRTQAKINDFIHYEISNFCKKGFYSLHNSNYWRMTKYLGLGPSAHSFNGYSRQWNISNTQQYIKSINIGAVPFVIENLSLSQQYNEYILTSIRTIWGCDPDYIINNFGNKYYSVFIKSIKKHIKRGQVVKKSGRFVLTGSGKIFVDGITADLFYD